MKSVNILDHEKQAMLELVINVRAMATVLGKDTPHCQRLMNWAQMVEDVVNRMDQRGH